MNNIMIRNLIYVAIAILLCIGLFLDAYKAIMFMLLPIIGCVFGSIRRKEEVDLQWWMGSFIALIIIFVVVFVFNT